MDVASLLISCWPPLGESDGVSAPVAWTVAEPSVAKGHPCPSKRQSCGALPILDWMSLEGGFFVCVAFVSIRNFVFANNACVAVQSFASDKHFSGKNASFADFGISLHFTNVLNCNKLLCCV